VWSVSAEKTSGGILWSVSAEKTSGGILWSVSAEKTSGGILCCELTGHTQPFLYASLVRCAT